MRDAHKGDRGRLLIVAGSLRMSGAARLAGWGALRGGAGLVTIATPATVQPVVAAELSCAMTLPLPDKDGILTSSAAAPARGMAESVDAIALGPGITTQVAPFLRSFLRGIDRPLAIDADALNCIAEEPALLDAVGEKGCVLTPHPGEAARLLGHEVKRDRESRLQAAAEIAERFGAVAVLKGAGTVVCDGEQFYVNRTGNPGMGTGGTGDVLTGLLGARLACPDTDPFAAAVQAVHIHGRAGDLAAAAVGENAMIATDLVANLAGAVAEITEPAAERSGKTDQRTGSRRRR
jgi:NAD(P)H-hydrate epimerase